MTITNYLDVKKLFDLTEPEGTSLDYKSLEYKFIRTSTIPETVRRKQRHELLKDVCGFLNSSGGVILIGVKEDHRGFPKGNIESGGIKKSELPQKYVEEIEHIVLTGINPPARISVTLIENESDADKAYIAINIPQQPHPLYSVIKNESGEERNELFVRRGRITGYLSVQEISRKITEYEQLNTEYLKPFNEIKNIFKNSTDQSVRMVLYAFPITTSFDYDVNKDEYIDGLLRGENANSLGGSSAQVTINYANNFPYPIFEGKRISDLGKSLEVWEKGQVISQVNLKKSHFGEDFFLKNDGSVLDGRFFILSPRQLAQSIINYYRFIISFYERANYFGEISTLVCLLPSDGLYAYKNYNSYIAHVSASDRQRAVNPQVGGLILDYDPQPYYGPRGTEKEEILIDRKINVPTFSSSNLTELDNFVTEKVLKYVWRAFTYESFPIECLQAQS